MNETIPVDLKRKFVTLLLKWNRKQNDRKMPWKGERDPYKIWLSEIILQQTRVQQGLSYYNKFIKTFPDIHKLAKAPDKVIFKMWEGLGYYTRCRNLIISARYISKELDGKFPDSYETIRSLKGIGPYTAAAISSFAFDLPYAVVDGNVFRVLSRVFGIDKPIDSTEGKSFFSKLANELLDKKHSAVYNQALMDFGAIICKPALPLCANCILKKNCIAFLKDRVNVLPVKEKSIRIKNRWFYYLVMEYKNEIIIRQRASKDIWQQLNEFPLVEMKKHTSPDKIIQVAEGKGWLQDKKYEIVSISPLIRQKLSHQLISGQFIKIRLSKKIRLEKDNLWIKKNRINQLAFPKFINQYLRSKE
ncbi:MAG: A/G-specific adenine glycosylase [Bacteroidota bacterium]